MTIWGRVQHLNSFVSLEIVEHSLSVGEHSGRHAMSHCFDGARIELCCFNIILEISVLIKMASYNAVYCGTFPPFSSDMPDNRVYRWVQMLGIRCAKNLPITIRIARLSSLADKDFSSSFHSL